MVLINKKALRLVGRACRNAATMLALLGLLTGHVQAAGYDLEENGRWIVVANRGTLSEAQAVMRRYVGNFPSTRIFSTTSGWYVVALGGVQMKDADPTLDRLIGEASVPSDSYLARGSTFLAEYLPGNPNTPVTSVPPVPPSPAAEPAAGASSGSGSGSAAYYILGAIIGVWALRELSGMVPKRTDCKEMWEDPLGHDPRRVC